MISLPPLTDENDLAWVQSVERANRRVGSLLQRMIQSVVFVLMALVLVPALRLLLRVELVGYEKLEGIGDRCIYAQRHFFEWDPIFLAFHPRVFWLICRRPHLLPWGIAGERWVRNALGRWVTTSTGFLGVINGLGERQSAMQRGGALLEDCKRGSLLICPTGPRGRKTSFVVYPGVGHLAVRCPEVPVLPITLIGVSSLVWSDVVLLRRPRVKVVLGAPFTAAQLSRDEATAGSSVDAVCRRIEKEWSTYEQKTAN